MIDWVPIQQKLVEAGYSNVPNGKIADSYRVGDYLYYVILFNSEQDEIWFKLRWL